MSANASWSARERPTEAAGHIAGAGSSGPVGEQLLGSNLPTPNAKAFEELTEMAVYGAAARELIRATITGL